MDQFQQFLTSWFGAAVQKVYIQPPSGMQMVYPCVVIERATGDTKFADNNPYRHQKRYLLTGISYDSDSGLYDLMAKLSRCVHNRSFSTENLNHDVFTIFFEDSEEEQ